MHCAWFGVDALCVVESLGSVVDSLRCRGGCVFGDEVGRVDVLKNISGAAGCVSGPGDVFEPGCLLRGKGILESGSESGSDVARAVVLSMEWLSKSAVSDGVGEGAEGRSELSGMEEDCLESMALVGGLG